MTGQVERSTKKEQPLRSKARGKNSSKEQSNVGTPEAEPSWTSWTTQALEAEPSCTPWQALATPWKMGIMWPTWCQHEPTCANLEPTWGQLGANIGQLAANLGQLGANLSQLGPTWANLGPTWATLESLGASCAAQPTSGWTRSRT